MRFLDRRDEARTRAHMLSLAAVLLLVCLAPLVSAADLTGQWSGSLEAKLPGGQAVAVPSHAEFKQRGDAVTGKVWKDVEQQFSIEKGNIAGNSLTFEFKAPEGSDETDPVVHLVRLSLVSENQLQGEVEFPIEGEKMTGKLRLAREK